jgi:hypothetical protein
MKGDMNTNSGGVIYSIYAGYKKPAAAAGFFQRKRIEKLFVSAMKEIVGAALDRFDIDTISFAVMEKDFHFLVWTGRNSARIAGLMQFIQTRFTERINRSLDREGPLWVGRWRSTILD